MVHGPGHSAGHASVVSVSASVSEVAPYDLQDESVDQLKTDAASLIRQLERFECSGCDTAKVIKALGNAQNKQDLIAAITDAYNTLPKAEEVDTRKKEHDAVRIQQAGMRLAGSLAGIASLNSGASVDALGLLGSPFAAQDSPMDPTVREQRNQQFVRNRAENALRDLLS